MCVLSSVYKWCTSGVRTAPTAALKASGWAPAVPPGFGLMNHILGTVTDALADLDTVWDASTVVVNVSVLGPHVRAVSGTLSPDYTDFYIEPTSTSQLVLMVDLEPLTPRNNTGGVTWTLASVRIVKTLANSGDLLCNVYQRDVTDTTVDATPDFVSSTSVTLPAGNDTTGTVGVAMHPDADTETWMQLNLVPDIASSDVRLFGIQLTFTRTGTP